MSHRNRIALATAALTAALFLATPSPSHAAAQPWKLPALDAWERAWSWLAHLLPASAPQKPGGVQEKEGSAINPDGRTNPTLASPPPGAQADEGGGTSSEGLK
jgi:hypothetical protein